MRIGLLCSNNLYAILEELLAARNIIIDESSNIFIVEAGYEIPSGKLAIVFEMAGLSSLIELVNKLSKNGDDASKTIIGKIDDKYEVIPLEQVFFYEARGNNVFCITANGEFKMKEKLYELEGNLPNNKFVRVSRSFIVNISNVKEVVPWFGRRLVLRFNEGKREVEVSKSYVKDFKDFLGI